MKTTQPLKWWGGKHYLAKKIIELMPRHLHYVEAYAGGLAVLLERDPHDPAKQWADKSYERGVSEVVNDIQTRCTTSNLPIGGERISVSTTRLRPARASGK